MQTTADLNANFGISRVLRFDEDNNHLTRAQVSTPTGDATIYMQGAHCTFWQPVGFDPVLFSGQGDRYRAEHAPHSGVPVIFPWFGANAGDANAPMHGFTRQQIWSLDAASMNGNDLQLTFSLGATDLSRSFGYGPFRLTLNFNIGAALTIELIVTNEDDKPLVFEEALHTYFAVRDAREVTVEGLFNTEYLDKVDHFNRKRQEEKFLRFCKRTDRVYLNTEGRCTLHDPLSKRLVCLRKAGSRSTVVWNPWSELALQYADIGRDGWPHFVCIETVNAAENAIRLEPGQKHKMCTRMHPEKIGLR